jgi:nucleoside-diphosphate-sugar epimerase
VPTATVSATSFINSESLVKLRFSSIFLKDEIFINDFEISINDLAKKVIAETGSGSSVVHIPYEEAYGDGFEDMERRVPNIELINELVGWKPQRNLSTMISDIANEMNA